MQPYLSDAEKSNVALCLYWPAAMTSAAKLADQITLVQARLDSGERSLGQLFVVVQGSNNRADRGFNGDGELVHFFGPLTKFSLAELTELIETHCRRPKSHSFVPVGYPVPKDIGFSVVLTARDLPRADCGHVSISVSAGSPQTHPGSFDSFNLRARADNSIWLNEALKREVLAPLIDVWDAKRALIIESPQSPSSEFLTKYPTGERFLISWSLHGDPGFEPGFPDLTQPTIADWHGGVLKDWR